LYSAELVHSRKATIGLSALVVETGNTFFQVLIYFGLEPSRVVFLLVAHHVFSRDYWERTCSALGTEWSLNMRAHTASMDFFLGVQSEDMFVTPGAESLNTWRRVVMGIVFEHFQHDEFARGQLYCDV
jgi:hypothetical protein